jgi:hypothetical protein
MEGEDLCGFVIEIPYYIYLYPVVHLSLIRYHGVHGYILTPIPVSALVGDIRQDPLVPRL